MQIVLLIISILMMGVLKSQTVSNGNFSSGTTAWSCNPETNPETVYGGSTANVVAEVDELAGLCQTISGFVIGSPYRLSIDYSRRTGACPGPNPAAGIVTISSGALSAGISSSAGTYSLQTSVFTFTATQSTLTLTIAANFTGTTCGLIIDNVSIVPYSILPIELLYFKALPRPDADILEWKTASQTDNAYFTVERSVDGLSWQSLSTIRGAGNSSQTNSYTTTVREILSGIYYYRLKQTDYNGRSTYSAIISVEREAAVVFSIYPNPANSSAMIYSKGMLRQVTVLSVGGEFVLSETASGMQHELDLKTLTNGVYFVNVYSADGNVMRKKLVVQR